MGKEEERGREQQREKERGEGGNREREREKEAHPVVSPPPLHRGTGKYRHCKTISDSSSIHFLQR